MECIVCIFFVEDQKKESIDALFNNQLLYSRMVNTLNQKSTVVLILYNQKEKKFIFGFGTKKGSMNLYDSTTRYIKKMLIKAGLTIIKKSEN